MFDNISNFRQKQWPETTGSCLTSSPPNGLALFRTALSSPWICCMYSGPQKSWPLLSCISYGRKGHDFCGPLYKKRQNLRELVLGCSTLTHTHFSKFKKKNGYLCLLDGKNGFVTATKLGTTNEFFVALTKNFAAATKRFVDRTKHLVAVCLLSLILTNDFVGITKHFFPCR